MWKRLIIIIFPVILAACSTSQASYSTSDNKPVVATATATEQVLAEENSYVGTLQADKKTFVTAQTNAIVKEIQVDVGETVRAGQLLIKLEDDPTNTVASASLSTARELAESAESTLNNLKKAKADSLKSAQTSIDQTLVSLDMGTQTISDLTRLKQEQTKSLKANIDSARTARKLAESNYRSSLVTGEKMVAGAENQKEQLTVALDTIEKRISDTKNIQREVKDIAESNVENAEDALEFAKDRLTDLEQSGAAANAISEAELEVLKAESQLEMAEKNEDQVKQQNRAELTALEKEKESILKQLNGSDISISQTDLNVQGQNDSLKFQVELAEKNVTAAENQLAVVTAQLDQQINSAEKQLDLAEAQYQSAKAALQSIRSEYDTKIAEAQTELTEIQTQVKMARVQSGYLNVAAPIDGEITKKLVSVGDLVAPGSRLLEITDLTSLEVEFSVSEEALNDLAPGDKITLLDPSNDESYPAVITSYSQQSSSYTRKTEVKASLADAGENLNDGQYVKVRLKSGARSRLVIPLEALHSQYKNDFVYVLEADNTVTKAMVETGLIKDNLIEITTGLEAGDWVVTRHDLPLRDNLTVTVNND